ncbi:MAG: ATP-binding cassette domain-containing protein [Gemmatimonadales bacterium]|nr:ATP-binding cassette domain-containing protein [Gemmatimonadales bacterium]
MTLLSVSGVSVEFGSTTLLSEVGFTVAEGDRWGILGRNGAGKTTLFRLLTGEMQPTRGTIARPNRLRVSLLEQHRVFDGVETVWEAAAGPFKELLALEVALAEQGHAMAQAGADLGPEAMDRYSRDLERFENAGGYTIAPRVDAVLHGLGFDPAEARQRPLGSLSGGERGRIGLARQLVDPADLLLLDEPTNHLDLETAQWLEDYLKTLSATVMVVSHDRAFLEAVADHILHVEAGTAVPYSCGYSAFVALRAERRLTQERAFQKQSRTVAKEEEFIRRHIAGQNSSQAKGRRRRLSRLPRLAPPPGEAGAMALRLEPAERGGDQVVVADKVGITIGERTLLRDFTATIRRGEVVGFIGPNGAGKTTLLKVFTGDREPESGSVRIGDSIAVAHYRQDLSQVPPGKTLFDIIHDLRPRWTRGQVQGHLGRFDFSGDEAQRRPESLSGGERARVALAIMMLSGANLLIFDEPTNHLDVESIEALEDAIEEYDGTVLLVSHDRALLRALTTRTWVLHGEHITDFPGGFDEWEVAAEERAHASRVAAQEEQAVRAVGERKRARGPAAGGVQPRTAARRAVEAAEARVAEGEQAMAALEAELQDPELYLTPEGTRRASQLGQQLEAARARFEAAFADWEAAVASLEALDPSITP